MHALVLVAGSHFTCELQSCAAIDGAVAGLLAHMPPWLPCHSACIMVF